MALWRALRSASLQLLMISVGLVFALLYILLIIITHPLSALRKKRRDSKFFSSLFQPSLSFLCL